MTKLVSYIIFILILTSSSFSQDDSIETIYVAAESHKTLEEQVQEQSRTDIANCKFILFSHGWPIVKIDKAGLEKLTCKYGFELENRGDVISRIDILYEDEVMHFLN